ncbi:MAG: RNA methyltransferase, partial [Kiritimatiellae bacterium]|nr:RNA methyltransferase [Kiritimatiellia bacterium]
MPDKTPDTHPAPSAGGIGGIGATRVVLVSPLYAGNVGSVCRAMANMGLSELVIVAPRIADSDWAEAERLAVHAGGILASRKTVGTFAEAIADCTAVAGATARDGLYRGHISLVRDAAPELAVLAKSGKLALVFGREDDGLDNAEIQQCTHLLRIPSCDGYRSLNLAQAVMVCLYELRLAAGVEPLPGEKSPPASAGHRKRLFEVWREAMLATGFMKEDKADHMMQG